MINIRTLADTPPWEWPRAAGAEILGVLRNGEASASDRLLAADMAGELVVMNDLLAGELLRILSDPHEEDDLRATAAISLGPALEEADLHADDDTDTLAVSGSIMQRARLALRTAYLDPGVPREVRRSALEASVRAPEPWHPAAVRAAYYDGDVDWRITALFCMRYIPGFESEILEGLESDDAEIVYQAVQAVKEQELDAAWPHVQRLVLQASAGERLAPDQPETEIPLLLAAMEATAVLRPSEARDAILELSEVEDEEISQVACEILDMLDGTWIPLEEREDDETTWH
jgi:uncharacterized protein (UPF0147 family)